MDTLVITGTLINCCCESTAPDAIQRNYREMFVTDGNATHSDWEHNATLCNMMAILADLQSTDDVLAAIAAGAGQASAA
ncbi:MAG TPA: isochorismatase family protein [Paracoccaceae bacterium]|nr:isochorismatase family protein [Paracoccaceae bacterium]